MKKQYIYIVSLIILVITLATILVVLHAKTYQAQTYTPTSNEITMTTVSTHSTSDSCWIIVGTKVYDLTPYIESHPNDSRFSLLCGKDGTATLLAVGATKDNVAMQKLIANYYIGILVP